MNTHQPLFSIIIPAKNEADALRTTLPEIISQARQTMADYEIILMDNQSVDETVEVSRRFGVKSVSVVGTVGNVRKVGVELARGKVLVFVDADCLPGQDWLRNGLMLAQAHNPCIVGAQLCRPQPCPWLIRYWALDVSERSDEPSQLPGASLFFMRDIIETIGNFNPELSSSEDANFTQRARRAGIRLIKTTDVSVTHLGWPDTIGGFLRRQAWHAQSYVQNNRGIRDSIMLASFSFLLGWPAMFALAVVGNWFAAGVAATLMLGLSASHAVVRICCSSESWSVKLIFFCTTISFLYFTGRALGLVFGLFTHLKRI